MFTFFFYNINLFCLFVVFTLRNKLCSCFLLSRRRHPSFFFISSGHNFVNVNEENLGKIIWYLLQKIRGSLYQFLSFFSALGPAVRLSLLSVYLHIRRLMIGIFCPRSNGTTVNWFFDRKGSVQSFRFHPHSNGHVLRFSFYRSVCRSAFRPTVAFTNDVRSFQSH